MKAVTSLNRADLVDSMMKKCLFKASEIVNNKPPEGAIIVDGVVSKFGFSPKRIVENKDDIKELLTGLPAQFYQQNGGGWSFLNLCMDADANQWGEHRNCEALCVLAIAAGYGQWCLSRHMWKVLPGGMPYIVLNLEGINGQATVDLGINEDNRRTGDDGTQPHGDPSEVQ